MIHSSTCQNALRALIYLAERNAPGPVLVSDIAAGSGVPRQSLAKILQGLRSQGLVRSTRGPGGGYRLARTGDSIRMVEVIEAVDGRVEMKTACVLGLDRCTEEASCALHETWKQFRDSYCATVATMTLRDAAEALHRKQTPPES